MFTLFTSLTGCATQYEAPTSGPTATLTVNLNNAVGDVFVGIRPPGLDAKAKDQRLTFRSARNGWEASPTNVGSFIIPASAQVTLNYNEYVGYSSGHDYSCTSSIQFIPQPGMSYVYTGGDKIYPNTQSLGAAMLSDLVKGPEYTIGTCFTDINPKSDDVGIEEGALTLVPAN